MLSVVNKEKFINTIKDKIEEYRPEFRRVKTISPDTSFEIVFDYTFSLQRFSTERLDYHSLTFEVRPKSAMFDEISFEEFQEIYQELASGLKSDPSLEELNTPDALKKYFEENFSKQAYEKLCKDDSKERARFTRFYKMQLKKRKDKRVESFTGYDPHQFFSNEISSINKALNDLFVTPQNNLKIFIDAKEINILEQKELLFKVLKGVLNTDSDKPTSPDSGERAFEGFKEVIAQILKQSNMIETVQQYQNLYTDSSLHMARIISSLENALKDKKDTMSDDRLKQIIQRVAASRLQGDKSTKQDDQVEEDIESLIRFLLSIAFRDCSILVSLHFVPASEEESKIDTILNKKGFKQLQGSNSNYKIMYTVGLIDFHIKDIRHAYSHPGSTRELFGLLIKDLLQNEFK